MCAHRTMQWRSQDSFWGSVLSSATRALGIAFRLTGLAAGTWPCACFLSTRALRKGQSKSAEWLSYICPQKCWALDLQVFSWWWIKCTCIENKMPSPLHGNTVAPRNGRQRRCCCSQRLEKRSRESSG